MANMFYLVLLGVVATGYCQQQQSYSKQQAFNPHILEDARVHPGTDGSFGFLYRTQDGISHAAKGVPGGAVQGRFTYTDPTGLKVNFNYNAGRQALAAPQQEPAQPAYQPQQQKYQQPQYQQTYEPEAYEPQPKYQPPKYPPKPRSRYVLPEPEATYEQPRYETAPRRESYSAPRQDSYSQNYVNDNYDQSYYQ